MNCEELEARYGREWHIHPLRWGVAAVRKRVPTLEQFAQGYLYALIGANPDDLATHLDPGCSLAGCSMLILARTFSGVSLSKQT